MKSFELTLFADYFQFYIQDEPASGDLSAAWTEQATDRLLAIAPGTVGIGTVRNMDVPVTVHLLERAPDEISPAGITSSKQASTSHPDAS